jgi:AraC family transcriptional regulator of arabinose operon
MNNQMTIRSGLAGNPQDLCEFSTDRSLQINNCGIIRLSGKNEVSSDRPGRIDYMLFYQWNGEGRFWMDNVCYPMTGGDLFIWRPGNRLRFTLNKGSENMHYWLHFTGTEAEHIINTCGFDKKSYHHIGKKQIICDLMYKIIHEIQLGDSCSGVMCNGYFLEIMGHIKRTISPPDDDLAYEGKSKIYPALHEMSLRFYENKPLDYYAQLCNVSRSWFVHLFTEAVRVTPREYITAKRIEQAKLLLNTSSNSVETIAYSVGYSDALYFSRVFKKHTGMSPTTFRKQNSYQ